MKRKKSPIGLRRSLALTSDTPRQLAAPSASSGHVLSPSSVASPALFHHLSTHNSSNSSEEHPSLEDVGASGGGDLETSALFANGRGHDMAGSGDDTDHSHIERTQMAIDHIHQKIAHTKELIKMEQTARDENVNEYLKLASHATDKGQLQRIKSIFEKKNQKSAQTISQLQKKLESYNKRIRELETHGLSPWQPREVLRDVGQGLKDVKANIKGGISGLSGSVMSKPREIAHLLKNRFGSADNITALGKQSGEEVAHEEGEKNHHGSATFTHSTKFTSEEDESESSLTSGSAAPAHVVHPPAAAAASSTSPTPHVPAITIDLEHILREFQERRDDYQRLLDEVETLKQECTFFHTALQEERERYDSLEEQLNDLSELHQNEVENLKQGIADMEEKVQYQSEERLRDVYDILDSCQTRISRMEHQQHQHLQQLVTLDSLENSTARPLVLKLINIALTLLQVILLLVSTLANIIMPFMRTRFRLLSTMFLVSVIVFLCHRWPEVEEWTQRHGFHLELSRIFPPPPPS